MVAVKYWKIFVNHETFTVSPFFNF